MSTWLETWFQDIALTSAQHKLGERRAQGSLRHWKTVGGVGGEPNLIDNGNNEYRTFW